MAAILFLEDDSQFEFHLGRQPAAIIARALIGVRELYLDGHEMEHARSIVEAVPLPWVDTGRSKTIVVNSAGSRALVAHILTSWGTSNPGG